jgi:uncharacterized protein (DUF1697 family)
MPAGKHCGHPMAMGQTAPVADPIVALLRGVNIGKRRVAMTVLRDGLEAAGCRDVVTYVQSGNIVLTPPTTTMLDDVDDWLRRTLTDLAGFDIDVVTRTASDLRSIVANNPYPGSGGAQLHVTFFSAEPVAPGFINTVPQMDMFAPEHCTLRGRELYLCLPDGLGRSNLAAAIEKTKRHNRPIIDTTRNWNTVTKLLELAGG